MILEKYTKQNAMSEESSEIYIPEGSSLSLLSQQNYEDEREHSPTPAPGRWFFPNKLSAML